MRLKQTVGDTVTALLRYPEELLKSVIPIYGETNLVKRVDNLNKVTGDYPGNAEEGILGRDMSLGENFACANMIWGSLPRTGLFLASAAYMLLGDNSMPESIANNMHLIGTAYSVWTGLLAGMSANYRQRADAVRSNRTLDDELDDIAVHLDG